MKVPFVFVVVVFLLKHEVSYASLWSERYSELDVYLEGYTLHTSKVNSIFACYIKCDENILCTSINMNLSDGTCELKSFTKTKHPEKVVTRKNIVYMEIRPELFEPGANPDIPISSCKALNSIGVAKSGVYWMKFNEPSSQPLQVYCDMVTDGGGWTLVYSYNFIDYESFNRPPNAVNPMPNWPIERAGKYTPVSTTVPLSNVSHSAMDFALWKKIGKDFLATSNINDWFSCMEGTIGSPGSLVDWKTGSIVCKRVKELVPRSSLNCTRNVPNEIEVAGSCAPELKLNTGDKLMKWESRTNLCYPVHDPCGTNTKTSRYLKNVPNAGGQIYIR